MTIVKCLICGINLFLISQFHQDTKEEHSVEWQAFYLESRSADFKQTEKRRTTVLERRDI